MSRKIRDSARGQDCQVRLPGVCNFNPETVVLAHKSGAGMGTKSPDIHAAYACSACHDAVDSRARTLHYNLDECKIYFYEGVLRTQLLLIQQGLLTYLGK